MTSEKIAEGAVGSRELANEIEVQTLGIRNAMGTQVAALGASDSNGAFFNLNNGAGNRMVGIFSTDDGRGNGSLGIFDSSGIELLGLHSTDAGSGLFTTRNTDGQEMVRIASGGGGEHGRISTRAAVEGTVQGPELVVLSRTRGQFGFLATKNLDGIDLARLTASQSGNGALQLRNGTGVEIASLSSTTSNGGFFDLNDELGNQMVRISSRNEQRPNGALRILNSSGNRIIELESTPEGTGNVDTKNSDGQEMVQITSGGGGEYGRISTRAAAEGIEEGPELVVVGRANSGAGLVLTKNAAGNTIVRLTSTTSGGMTSGFVSVRNAAGTQTAGINGRTGTVFGNTKSFIVPDPSQPGRKIRYTSLEGPEAAIYVRGSAELLQGQGTVEFPEHFAALSVESSITVNLTPRSADSLGLAVVEVSPEGFEVRELLGGLGSYPFDYVAYGVRKGYEDYPVYIEEGRSGTGVETNADEGEETR